jgi:hypothetical protein
LHSLAPAEAAWLTSDPNACIAWFRQIAALGSMPRGAIDERIAEMLAEHEAD